MPIVVLQRSWPADTFRRTIQVGKRDPVQLEFSKDEPVQVNAAEWKALQKKACPLAEIDPTRAARIQRAKETSRLRNRQPQPIGGVEAVVTGEASDAEG